MKNNLNHSRELGFAMEQEARKHLEAHGLTLVESNFSGPGGEIDLIMDDKGELVFTEVRARNNQFYGNGLESVDKQKRARIVRTATFYLQQHDLLDKARCRFDVVATSTDIHGNMSLEWIQDAFRVGD